MKIRIGFVSNSSSSSFVMVGAKVSNIDRVELAKKLLAKYPVKLPDYIKVDPTTMTKDELDDWTWEVMDALSGNCPFEFYGEENLFGFSIYSGSSEDYGLEDFSLSIEEIEKAIAETKEIMVELGIAAGEIKLIGGQRAC